jgi:hypothetical protein
MSKPVTAALAFLGAALLSAGAAAAPSFCTGTTMQVGSGGTVTGAFLLNGTASSGNCVEAGDKIFGSFSVGGSITGAGAASFSFSMTPGNVTEGFLGTPIGPNSTGFVDYSVAVDPALSQGFLIENLEKDFTFNAVNLALPASATLTGTTTADPAFMFNCTRTSTPSGGTSTCPQTDVFGFVSQMTVNQTITTQANAVVTALTDTVSQAAAVPEPSSLAILGGALLSLGLWCRRRYRYVREV